MEGFEEWVAARRGALARTAYLLTGDVHLAEDLVQETLARVAQHWRLERRDAYDAYTRTVMHHLAIDRWRRRKVRPPEVLGLVVVSGVLVLALRRRERRLTAPRSPG